MSIAKMSETFSDTNSRPRSFTDNSRIRPDAKWTPTNECPKSRWSIVLILCKNHSPGYKKAVCCGVNRVEIVADCQNRQMDSMNGR